MKRKPKYTKYRKKGQKITTVESGGLRPEWVRFIDEYMVDFNGTRAYAETYKCKRGSARNRAAIILQYPAIKEEIKQRLDAQRATESFIISGLMEVATTYRGAKTIGAAVKSLETLARIRNMIKADNPTINFFENNSIVFQPIIDNEGKKKFEKIIEVKGRLIE